MFQNIIPDRIFEFVQPQNPQAVVVHVGPRCQPPPKPQVGKSVERAVQREGDFVSLHHTYPWGSHRPNRQSLWLVRGGVEQCSPLCGGLLVGTHPVTCRRVCAPCTLPVSNLSIRLLVSLGATSQCRSSPTREIGLLSAQFFERKRRDFF
jgi:hypothetical protein